MKLTQAQLKGRLKSLAQKNHADARILIRIYMMERFLERVSTSRYKDNFIIKGGILELMFPREISLHLGKSNISINCCWKTVQFHCGPITWKHCWLRSCKLFWQEES